MKKIIGPLIFIIAAVSIWYFQYAPKQDSPISVIDKPPPSAITITGYIGGEKSAFVRDPQVKQRLKDRYGITFNATKAGSLEMVTGMSVAGMDVLWPSNRIAVDVFRQKGGTIITEENIFNSPIVIYAYDIVADALIREGIVTNQAGIFYITDFQKLIRYILEGRRWKDIGLPQLYGKVVIQSTDPSKSNSGNMFAGLMANLLNNGSVVTSQTVDQVIPKLVNYFRILGHMEDSSGDIFKNFIITGVGAKPMIVGYENQLVEFILENERYADYIRQKIRVLYPIPTVWSSHPIMALTTKGKRLIEAMKDDGIQQMAWETHGFRSGLLEVENDPAVLNVTGIPKEITAVMPLPEAMVMEKIIAGL